MPKWVVGTTVLKRVCEETLAPDRDAYRFLDAILQRHSLAVDDGGQIIDEYKRTIKPRTFGDEWWRQMSSHHGKIRHLASGKIQSVEQKLASVQFDSDDQKFVRVAVNTDIRTLVSESNGYSSAIVDWLRNSANVQVLGINAALAYEPTLPEEHSVPGEPVMIQTPHDRLKVLKNDYMEAESLFQQGVVQLVDLVDAVELGNMPEAARDEFLKEKRSIQQGFLEGPTQIGTLSIVIPVRGRKATLLECLESIRRQTFIRGHPDKVEILIVQDGYFDDSSEDPICEELFEKASSFPRRSQFRMLRLRENKGRATSRNVGIHYASSDVVFFIDSSMILQQDFLTEHMMRHQRCPNIALLGFKRNLVPESYLQLRDKIAKGEEAAGYRGDLKWSHVLTETDGDVDFRGQHYGIGDTICYMSITNNLKDLDGVDSIGLRTLPMFFQTNIASVGLSHVKSVGGFNKLFDPLWGFEDSHLGALLLAKGVKLVPCPSSVAFKIEHPEDETKALDIKRSGQKYDELLGKVRFPSGSRMSLDEGIKRLMDQDILEDVTPD